MLTVASWNVNSLKARLDHVVRWCESARPDVLALQETKTIDANFPFDALSQLGYHAEISGQPAYNGVAVLSRTPPSEVITGIPGFADEQKRVLGVRLPQLFVLNLYVPNGSAVGSDKYAYKLAWLDALLDWLPQLLAAHPRLLIVGDFNVAPEDRDVHDPAAWRDQILCSEPERSRIQRLTALGFIDTFRLFEAGDGCFSWWDYRAAGFRRNLGLRIDLSFASQALANSCRGSAIDREPRGWEKPSDHAPVIAHFELCA